MASVPSNGVVAYFGYGSLVNRATHRTDIVSAHRARLNGWRRFWRPRPDMPFDAARATPVSLLTVGPAGDGGIDGLLIVDRADNLAAVDEREARYVRRLLAADALTMVDEVDLPGDCPLYVYEAHADVPEPDGVCPIYQSYLDAVLQGFLCEYGEQGMRDFVFGTGNFETPVLADRAQPNYPRSVRLDAGERSLIDAALAERGVSYVEA